VGAARLAPGRHEAGGLDFNVRIFFEKYSKVGQQGEPDRIQSGTIATHDDMSEEGDRN
jgi:hypothetical protein